MKKGIKIIFVLSLGLLLFSCKKKTTMPKTTMPKTSTITTKPKTSTITTQKHNSSSDTKKKNSKYVINVSLSDNDAGTVSGAGFYDADTGATLIATENIGYSFLGWYAGDEKLTSYYEYNFIVNEDACFIAKFEKIEPKECIIEFDDDCGNPNLTQTLLQGEKIYEPAKPQKEGHSFIGWYADDIKWDFNFAVTRSMKLKAKWQINEYNLTLTSNMEAGTISDSNTYIYGEEIELEETTYLGYDFLGWYANNEKLDSNILNMPGRDLTVEARFKVKDDMSIFNFDSTFTTCNITGVKKKNIESIVVPDYVTSISEGAFNGCSILTSITLPFIGINEENKDEEGWSYPFGYVFGNDEYYNSYSAHQFIYFFGDDDSTYNFDAWYYIPESLEEVTLTKSKKIIDWAFCKCEGLKKVVLPENIDYLGDYLFSECTSLEEVELPTNITIIPNAIFYYCNNLTHVNIPENIVEIKEFAFSSCEKLNNVVLPNNLMIIGKSAFDACLSFTKIVIPKNVIWIGNSAFSNCSCEIEWENNSKITIIGEGAFRYYRGNSLTIPDGVKKIEKDAFYGCNNLESIILPSNLTTIGFAAFYNCIKIQSITIPKNVEEINNRAFMDCNFSTIIVDSENEFYDSRENCNAIISSYGNELVVGCKNTIIPSTVKYIGDYAFESCYGLTSITIPGTINSIGKNAFYNCQNLNKIVILDGVKKIKEHAFVWCGLEELVIPNSVTEIGEGILNNCKVKRLTLPFIGSNEYNSNSSTKYNLGYLFGNDYSGDGFDRVNQHYQSGSSISQRIYYIPQSLKEVVITKASYLQYGIFDGCSHITKVVLPSTLTTIADNAFINSSINKIYYMGDSSDFSQVTVGETGNTCINSNNIYFYSESNPGVEGNYWHYDTDGFTIVEW